LGGHTAFIGKVGADSFGDFLAKTLSDIGIETQGLIRSKTEHTTLAFVELDEKGDRSFTFYRNPGADTMLTPDEVDESLILGSRILHFGSVSLSREPARSATLHAIQTAKNAGKIISYDPNDRPLLWEDTDQARRIMREYATFADIIKVSEEELYLLTGEADPIKGAALLTRLGPTLVLISMGSKGAFYYMEGLSGAVPTYDVKTINTNGAGDAFLGAVHAQIRNRSIDEIQSMRRDELENIVAFANAAGALTTTKNGAISAMPTVSEVEECMRHCPLLS
jgi:fructokinase